MRDLRRTLRPRLSPTAERLCQLACTYSTIRLSAIAEERGLSEDAILAAADVLRLHTFTRAGVRWICLNANQREKDFKGDAR